jgi:hypothetical protein
LPVNTKMIALLLSGLAIGAGLGAGAVYALLQPEPAVQTSPMEPLPPAAPRIPSAPPAAPSQPALPSDADQALTGVRAGEMLPLQDILSRVRTRFPGEILGVELSEDDGIAQYEIKILATGGRVLELEVDPRTGTVLDVDEDD